MLTVGDGLPMFRLSALVRTVGETDGQALERWGLYGKWLGLLYWPKDFALLCDAERDDLARIADKFAGSETRFLAVTLSGDQTGLTSTARGLPFPVLADVDGKLGAGLGLEPRRTGCSVRATFVADPAGTIRWVSVSDHAAGRNMREAAEVLRTLQGGAPAAQPASDNELIAMCAWCRRLRDGESWHDQESYIRRRTRADFTHGICHDCMHDQSARIRNRPTGGTVG